MFGTNSNEIAGLCNGSTADSDSVCEGSNPSPAAKSHQLKADGFFFFMRRTYFLSESGDHNLTGPLSFCILIVEQTFYIGVRLEMSCMDEFLRGFLKGNDDDDPTANASAFEWNWSGKMAPEPFPLNPVGWFTLMGESS